MSALSNSISKISNALNPYGILMGIIGFLITVFTIFFNNASPNILFRQETILFSDLATANSVAGLFSKIGFNNEGIISVLDSNGRKISGNIYVSQLSVWNAGSVSLKPEMIREPTQFVLNGATNILSVSSSSANPRDGLEIIREENSNSIIAKWRYMDPMQGFKLTILYEASEPANIGYSSYMDVPMISTKVTLTERYPLNSLIVIFFVLIFPIFIMFSILKSNIPYKTPIIMFITIIPPFILIYLTFYGFRYLYAPPF